MEFAWASIQIPRCIQESLYERLKVSFGVCWALFQSLKTLFEIGDSGLGVCLKSFNILVIVTVTLVYIYTATPMANVQARFSRQVWVGSNLYRLSAKLSYNPDSPSII